MIPSTSLSVYFKGSTLLLQFASISKILYSFSANNDLASNILIFLLNALLFLHPEYPLIKATYYLSFSIYFPISLSFNVQLSSIYFLLLNSLSCIGCGMYIYSYIRSYGNDMNPTPPKKQNKILCKVYIISQFYYDPIQAITPIRCVRKSSLPL